MTIKSRLCGVTALTSAIFLSACGGSGSSPTPPPSPVTTTTTIAGPTPSPFEMSTLITVYKRADAFAEFTEGTTRDERLLRIVLGDAPVTGGTILRNNEVGRLELNQTIGRIMSEFEDADFTEVFDETKANLRRFFNDADNDGWSVDGRHGEGRDWPHDADGNDPDGWTSQMVIELRRVQ